MPNKKDQDNIELNNLEKKVDAMMAPGAEVPAKAESVAPAAPAPQAMSQPAGVPEVPKKLQKGLDAFSTDAPDITVEPDTEAADTEQAQAAQVVDPATTIAQTDINSPATDEAVTDIVREEADTLLEIDDADTEDSADDNAAQNVDRKWWRSKRFIYAALLSVIVICVALAAVPKTRYVLLNLAGVRSQASLKVVDERTRLPLKNVTVKIGVAETKTDAQGVAQFDMVRLGAQDFVVERVAFAPIRKNIVVGWGSNPLGEMKLQATGVRYELKITDYVSGKIVQAEATSGESVAIADSKGVANLVIEDVSKPVIEIMVQANGYRTEKVLIDANRKTATNVALTPSKPIVYVSKQSGRYDVYRIDADGKNKQLVLAGTGRESQDIRVALSPDSLTAAIVSSRGTKRDARGMLLDTLTLVTLKSGVTKTIDEAQDINLEDWISSQLVYTATYPKDDTTEQRLVTYNIEESARTGLATSSYFSTVASIGGYIYYANTEPDQTAAMAYQKIRPDGSGKQSILEARVLSATRTGYETISLETADGWYAYKAGDATATKGSAPPDSYITRQYALSPDGSQSVWIDNRDGKGVLVLLHDQKTDKETSLVTAGGLAAPMRWLNNTTIAYRVTNSNETAEYIKSTAGGSAKKVVDATNVGGLRFNF
jgi:hypothetical protein